MSRIENLESSLREARTILGQIQRQRENKESILFRREYKKMQDIINKLENMIDESRSVKSGGYQRNYSEQPTAHLKLETLALKNMRKNKVNVQNLEPNPINRTLYRIDAQDKHRVAGSWNDVWEGTKKYGPYALGALAAFNVADHLHDEYFGNGRDGILLNRRLGVKDEKDMVERESIHGAGFREILHFMAHTFPKFVGKWSRYLA